MGRNLSLGIVTTLRIEKKKDIWKQNDIDLFKSKEEIKKELEKTFDISNYDWYDCEDSFVLTLKPEHFNANIHELIKELYPLIDCRIDLFGDSDDYQNIKLDENFNSDNYPITIEAKEKGFRCSWYSTEWLDSSGGVERSLFDNKEYCKKINITAWYIPFWYDCSKISMEDETILLSIMNKMSRTYLKTALSKNILFFIVG